MSAAKRKNQRIDTGINCVYLIILGILFSYPLFRQGLWFDFDWNPYQVVVFVCALAFFVYNKPKTSAVSLAAMDYAAIAFAVIYGLSVLVAVDTNMASQQALKVITYVTLFALVARSLSTLREVQILLRIFYWAGFLVVFYSMGAAFGTFTYEGALVADRLYSILEYPNILACYTLAVFFIGLYLGERVTKVPWQIVYTFGNYFIIVGFFAAKSRGAFLTMGVALLIYIFGLGKMRIRIIPKLIIFLASGYLFIDKLFNPTVQHAQIYYWGILLIASIPALLTVLLRKIDTSNKRFLNVKLAVGIGIVLLIAVIIVGAKMNLFSSRIFNFSANAGDNISERFIFYQDAVKIIKDYPLLGTGGGGWESLYRQYQGYGYLTTQVHNHYLQVWVETGTLGFLAFVGIWVSAISLAIRLMRRGKPENRFLVWSLLSAILVIGIHSFGDFSLSMPAIMILLWGLFGCLRAVYKIEKVHGLVEDKLTYRWNAKPVIVAIAGIMMFLSIFLFIAQNYGDQGLADLQAKDFSNAAANLEVAASLNPLASVYWSALGETRLFISSEKDDTKLLNIALGDIDKAIRMDPNNPNFRLVKGKGLLLADRIEDAVGEFEMANKLAPWDQKYVDRLAETYAAVGQYYYYNHDQAKAEEYLERAVNYHKMVTAKANSMDPKYRQLQARLGPVLTVSDKIQAVTKMAEELKMKI